MFWKKKTPLQQQIEAYEKDQETLLEFARTVAKPRIEEVTMEDVKGYYRKVIEPMNSLWERTTTMKAVRKFFRYYRSENTLNPRWISDNPLETVELNVIMPFMQKTEKKKRGRPANVEMINKVKVLREQGQLTFRQIAAAIGEDVRQAHLWYMASKNNV